MAEVASDLGIPYKALERWREKCRGGGGGPGNCRWQTIPGVGEVLALNWALEVGQPERFNAVGNALSYCGLAPKANRVA